MMLTTNAFATIGSLIGDPARANMLAALMDGRALTASELAAIAGVTPQTASSHLGQLVNAGLLAVERQGRHRYHRLATLEVARMVEGMMAVASTRPVSRKTPLRVGPNDHSMRRARTCYDHLAGSIAVGIADAMIARDDLVFTGDGGELTASGVSFFARIGVDLPQPGNRRGRGRLFCRPCLDWSERRPHIAGAVGSSLLRQLEAKHWIRRTAGSRIVAVTPAGRTAMWDVFGLDEAIFA